MEEKENIEQFFEKHLNRQEFQFQEEDWSRMEHLLDTAGFNVRPSIKRMPVLPTIGIIILAFVGGWFGHQWMNDQEHPATIQSVSPESHSNSANQENELRTTNENFKTMELESKSLSASPNPANTVLNIQTGGKSVEQATKPYSSIQNKKLKYFPTNSAKDVETTNLIKSMDHTNVTVSDNQKKYLRYSNATQLPNATQLLENHSITSSHHHIDYITDDPDLISLPLIIPEKIETSHSVNPLQPSADTGKKLVSGYSPWSIGLSLSPDFNSVGFGNQSELSWETGLHIYYQFHPSWRITTGILYGKKKYISTGNEYSPPSGYWENYTGGQIPEIVNGECMVIDIPLNISYIWNSNSKFTLLSTIGVSNYFLQSEDYSYEFKYMHPGSYSGWSTEKNSNSVVGMLNLGVGFDYRLTTRLNFMAEPFLRMPLKEIGFGNIHLYGSGALLTLRYKFFMSKNN